MCKNFDSFFHAFKHESWGTLSNLLTALRIILAPVVVFGIYVQAWAFTFVLFLIAVFTDLFDGYYARLFKQQTYIGTVLDPIADKLFLICCFGALSFWPSPSFSIPTWFFWMVVGRELFILIGASILVALGSNLKVRPTIWGKLTTFFQLLFLSWIFICYFFGWAPVRTYSVFLVLLALFSMLSFMQYVKIGLHSLKR
ncbi:MAG: CDP-alcohol phosphatidyltransferase family protein [bacterium]